MDNPIFSLDIGTQSVAGILLNKSDDTYKVIDYYIKPHDERAMLDGQIHNVVKVAEVLRDVTEKLAKKHGDITSVRVAAAGRSLKTIRSEASITLNKQPITDETDIRFLELDAVQNAQKKLLEKQKNKDQDYYCVGYSVIHYILDGEPIGSLIDQTGDIAAVEVIATFLPQVVVESLLSSLQRANLTMEALTLEPIAAINVLVPDSMRRLNVALVDIGAGTSDIAITKDGTVTAYGMVAQAGDEITEAISDQFLLDFEVAEKAKKQIVNEGSAIVEDILGFPTELTKDQVIDSIRPTIEKLAESIANEILQLNNKAPQAVMLIGGGSLTPFIDELLAEKLHLPNNRIALRTVEAIRNIENLSILPQGPDFITPLGIAISSENSPINYTSVYINDQSYRLFDINRLTIGDCLIHAGVSIRNMYGSPGLAYIVTFNGNRLTLPGSHGKPPILTLNGKPTSIENFVKDGDRIFFERGLDGENPYVSLKQLVDEIQPLTIVVNQTEHTFYPKYIVNGEERDDRYVVQDKDEIIVEMPNTVGDVLRLLGEEIKRTAFPIYVDGKLVNMKKGTPTYLLNNKEVNVATPIKQQDHLLITFQEKIFVKDVLEEIKEDMTKKIQVTFNGEKIALEKESLSVYRNNVKITKDTPVLPNDQLTLKKRQEITFIFQDVFRYVDIDLNNITGHYKIYINDQVATFFDEIKDGDDLALQ